MSPFCDTTGNFSYEGQSDVSASALNCHLNYCIIVLFTNWCAVWCLHVSNLLSYLQNSSKLQLSLNCGISKQWIETKRWSDKSSGSERHVDICLSSLSLPFPSFYFLPHSDQRDRNPPQQLSVQTDSVKRFPSIFLSLAHTHTQITSLLFCTQMHFFPSHTFIKRVRVLLQDENVFVRDAFCLERAYVSCRP